MDPMAICFYLFLCLFLFCPARPSRRNVELTLVKALRENMQQQTLFFESVDRGLAQLKLDLAGAETQDSREAAVQRFAAAVAQARKGKQDEPRINPAD